MLSKKRRRRIERFKIYIRIFRFLRRKIPAVGCICIVLAILCAVYFVFSTESSGQIAEAKEEIVTETDPSEKFAISQEKDGMQENESALPDETEAPKDPESLTNQAVYPADTYAEAGTSVKFKCYHPDASRYKWEQYDPEKEEWVLIDKAKISLATDELLRPVSCCTLNTTDEEQTLRCTILFTGQENIVTTAKLYSLSQEIMDIEPADASFPAGEYINGLDYPVNVVYQDGEEEELKGLYGLYFLEQEEDTEYATSISGNRVETVTCIRTEHEYTYASPGKEKISLRYRKDDTTVLDKESTLSGEDTNAPVISSVDIGEYTVSNTDTAVPVTVSVTANDDFTLQSNLVYAFLPEGSEPGDNDWKESSEFGVDIDKNGMWTAYCRDEYGNISSEKREIIAVDQKAPVISATLANDDWCQTNTILVKAEDQLPVTYSYACQEAGKDSGWTASSQYIVEQNGLWEIQVKDSAGNITSTEIMVGNIDRESPKINSIIVVEEGEQENE